MKSHQKINKYALILTATLVLVSIVSSVNAQGASQRNTYNLLEPLPCLAGSKDCVEGTQVEKVSFANYAQYAYNLLIAVAAVAAVFMIVLGGLEYMTTDSWQGKKAGKDKALNAVYGLILALSSYLILKTIDPRLVEIHPSFVEPICSTNPRDPDYCGLRNNFNSFFSDLIAEAARHNITANEFNASAAKTQAQVEMLEKDRAVIQQQVDDLLLANGYNYADIDVAELSAQIQKIDIDINNKRGEVLVDSAKSLIENGAISTTETELSVAKTESSINKSIQTGLEMIKITEANKIQKLIELGEFEQVQEVKEHADYAEVTLAIAKQDAILKNATFGSGLWKNDVRLAGTEVFKYADAKAIMEGEIKLLEQRINKIEDPAYKAELTAKVAATRSEFTKKFTR